MELLVNVLIIAVVMRAIDRFIKYKVTYYQVIIHGWDSKLKTNFPLSVVNIVLLKFIAFIPVSD